MAAATLHGRTTEDTRARLQRWKGIEHVLVADAAAAASAAVCGCASTRFTSSTQSAPVGLTACDRGCLGSAGKMRVRGAPGAPALTQQETAAVLPGADHQLMRVLRGGGPWRAFRSQL